MKALMKTSPAWKAAILAAAAATSAALPLFAAVPEVTGVTMTQATDRLVTISYTLSDAPAVVTVDIQTNMTGNAWESIGGEAVWNAMGDVWKRVETGSRTITWHPDHSWPDHKIADGGARAVVTAWALENTPDYMVVDLAAANSVYYYPAADFLPGSEMGQKGAITNNPAYKTSKLVMRKIMSRGVTWTMGSAAGETQRTAEREAAHPVTLTNNYYIGVFEVTQAQWKNSTATNTARFTVDGAMRPMEQVCYNEIRNASVNTRNANVSYDWPADPNPSSFLGLLRTKTGLDFDLPSEAQWEFAARAGNGSGFWGDGSEVLNSDADANLNNLGRYLGNNPAGTSDSPALAPAAGGTAIVGSYAPNAWGLYDMHGNVFELCLDWYERDLTAYGGRVNIDTSASAKTLSGGDGQWRVIRGGNWYYGAARSRSAFRDGTGADTRVYYTGFRLACTAGLR